MLLMMMACNNAPQKREPQSKEADFVINDTLLHVYGKNVLIAARDSDFKTIASYIYPLEGMRLVPFGFIDIFSAQRLTGSALLRNTAARTMLMWGSYGGDGASITLSPTDYFRRFVYDADYLSADSVTCNRSVTPGGACNNIAEVYPGSGYIEYFARRKADKEDWSCIRLVFGRQNGRYYLLAIIHDEAVRGA